MDVDVNEDERLTNFTLGHKIKLMNSGYIFASIKLLKRVSNVPVCFV